MQIRKELAPYDRAAAKKEGMRQQKELDATFDQAFSEAVQPKPQPGTGTADGEQGNNNLLPIPPAGSLYGAFEAKTAQRTFATLPGGMTTVHPAPPPGADAPMTAVPPSTQAGMAPAEAGLQGMAAAMRALEQEQVASATTLNAATDSLSGNYPAASAAGGRSKKTAASDKDDGIAPTAWPGEPGEGGVDEDAQALADAAAREPGASAVQSDPFDSFAQLSDPFDKAAAAAADAQIETMWSCSGGAGKSMSETSLQQLAPAGEEGGAPVSELLGGGGGGGPQQTPPPPGGLRTDLPTGVPDLPTDVWASTVDAGAGERVQLVNASTLQRAAGGVPVCNLPTTGAQPPPAQQQPPRPPPPPQKEEDFELVVPPGASPGDTLMVDTPSGQQVALTIPDGAVPGTTLSFAAPAPEAAAGGVDAFGLESGEPQPLPSTFDMRDESEGAQFAFRSSSQPPSGEPFPSAPPSAPTSVIGGVSFPPSVPPSQCGGISTTASERGGVGGKGPSAATPWLLAAAVYRGVRA